MKPTVQDIDWMKKVKQVATGSGCVLPNSRVGAIAVRDGEVIMTGVNGVVGKITGCEEADCMRREIPSGTRREYAYCICAEQRMICKAAREGVSLKGAVAYVSHCPCATCVRMMIASGFEKAFYSREYNDPLSHEIAEKAGFDLIHINMENKKK